MTKKLLGQSLQIQNHPAGVLHVDVQAHSSILCCGRKVGNKKHNLAVRWFLCVMKATPPCLNHSLMPPSFSSDSFLIYFFSNVN